MTEREIFTEALQIDDPGRRAAYLAQACANDEKMRVRVESLLAAQASAGGFLEAPHPLFEMPLEPHADDKPGSEIGAYRLVKKFGQGGMGVVWQAEQIAPVTRTVALKLILPGMDSRGTISRFEVERQTLAIMEHPNIARVFDAGVTQAGRLYFVMELVQGVPLTQYCDQRNLTVHERLELFVVVCRAIEHAHQKGIIHRDIKPSNILVEEHDGRPVPKVIDFGLAKAIRPHNTESLPITERYQLIGTPAYMSPEQAQVGPTDIDTRSDVYSLGTVLYELLISVTPFDEERLRAADFERLQRIIREEDAVAPSRRLIALGDSVTKAACHRGVDAHRLIRIMQGDLDWIVLKTLEKDRNRRYGSASDLASDIERFLGHEAVLAGPPSNFYRIRKFARRNRGAVTAGGLIVIALVAGMTGTTIGLMRANKAEKDARNEATNARNAEGLAEGRLVEVNRALAEKSVALEQARASRKTAERESKRLSDALDYLVEIFRRPDPSIAGRDMTVLGAFDAARDRLRTDFKDDPQVKATLLMAMGRTYSELGDYEVAVEMNSQARELLLAAEGPDHRDAMIAANNLALSLAHIGRLEEAIPIFEETLEARQRNLGERDQETLTSMNNLGMAYHTAGRTDEGRPLVELALELRRTVLGPESPATITSLANVALIAMDRGRFADAVRHYEEALGLRERVLGQDHFDTIKLLTSLGEAYRAVGQPKMAIPILQGALDRLSKKAGADHPETMSALNNLASMYQAVNSFEQALPLFQRLVDRCTNRYGTDHPTTLLYMNNLAGAYVATGDLESALPLFETVLRAQEKTLGKDHQDTLVAKNNLANVFWRVGRRGESIKMLEEVVSAMADTVGAEHPDTFVVLNNLAARYLFIGLKDEAIDRFERVLRLRRESKHIGPRHPDTILSMQNLAEAYVQSARATEAASLLEGALALCRTEFGIADRRTQKTMERLSRAYAQVGRRDDDVALCEELVDWRAENLGRTDAKTIAAKQNLAVAYDGQQNFAKAESLWNELVAIQRELHGPEHLDVAEALELLGGFHIRRGQFDAAESAMRGCLEIRTKITADSWVTFNTMSQLGSCLKALRQFADAEPLLIEGYRKLKASESSIPSARRRVVQQALDRIVLLYDEWEKPEEAARWRSKPHTERSADIK